MNEQLDLEDEIRGTIREYRLDRGYFGGSGMTDRDQTNLVHRLAEVISEKLAEIDRTAMRNLKDEISFLEQELQRAKGPGYDELRNEYEGMAALAKHLIYRLGKEDGTISVTLEELHQMEQNVDLMLEEEDGLITLSVEEYEP